MVFQESLFKFIVWILGIVFDIRDLRFVDGFIVAYNTRIQHKRNYLYHYSITKVFHLRVLNKYNTIQYNTIQYLKP